MSRKMFLRCLDTSKSGYVNNDIHGNITSTIEIEIPA